MAKRGWRGPESSPLSCIVSGVRESRSAGRSTQEPPDSIVRKIHPSKIADVMVARRARVRVAAKVGLERRNCMPARCGHCSTCASDQMLRRITPTAERTVTRGGDKKPLTKETRLENGPTSTASKCQDVVAGAPPSPYCQNELLRAIELRGTSKSLPIPKSTNLTTPIASRLVAR